MDDPGVFSGLIRPISYPSLIFCSNSEAGSYGIWLKSLLEYRGLCEGPWGSQPFSARDCFILKVHFMSLHCIFIVHPPIQDYLCPSVIYPTGYMTCESPSLSFKISYFIFLVCVHSLLYVCLPKKNYQHIVLPEIAARSTMCSRSICACICSYVCYCSLSPCPKYVIPHVTQGQQKSGEAHVYMLQPPRKSRWP